MKKLLLAAAAVFALFGAETARAQAVVVGGVGNAVTDCTTVTPRLSNNTPIELDQYGRVCVNGTSGGGGSSGPYVYTALGCGQIASFSSATLLSSVSGGIPAGATLASLSVESNAVRYRDDGTSPTATVGTPLAVSVAAWPYSGALSAIKFIPQTGSATVDVCFYK